MRGTILSIGVDVDLGASSTEPVSDYLTASSVNVVGVSESADGLARAVSDKPSVILLGDDETRTRGIELLTTLRHRTWCPILVVGSGSDTTAVSALLQGADMYLRRPVENVELIARIHALLRRGAMRYAASRSTSASPLEDSALPSEVTDSLTETEARLLGCLMERRGKIVSHDELMARVWGGPVKRERLRFYVYSLRQKLGASPSLQLETKQGFGYRIVSVEASHEASHHEGAVS